MQQTTASHVTADPARKASLGQFFTPAPVADFMASLFNLTSNTVDLLDAGSGEGALTEAFVRSLTNRRSRPKRINVTAYELDPAMIQPLRATLSRCHQSCDAHGIEFSCKVLNEDFVLEAAEMVRGSFFMPLASVFTTAIVNPPYKKIRSDSITRASLRRAGIETSNLYAGFVALICRLLAPRGELVAITPRSFCNGPYFKPFRLEFLETMSLRQLHVFDSRSAAFRQDEVLQENVILHAVKGITKPHKILISRSSGEPGDKGIQREVDFEDVVSPNDGERFIRLLTEDQHACVNTSMERFEESLDDLGLGVSTGRVVDFRARSFLRMQPSNDTVPLIYPCHFRDGYIDWPMDNRRKPSALLDDERTRELQVPSGVYVLTKRFTAKEERRRIVACIYDPDRISAKSVGFENHLNYFHSSGAGIPLRLAKGLTLFLNSSLVDTYFRQFSGHTQVNATDLRGLRYPSREALEHLGDKVEGVGQPQEKLDHLIAAELF